MPELRALKLLFFVFLAFSASGQKVKYKDIYSLLSTKQYEAAEPFLKQYLAGDQGNPNAFLFMGIIYQEKSVAFHVLQETEALVAYADSAIHCFDKAVSLLTERELKRNGDYYQAYRRRDLRTGEFGLALSDIQFDLQKRKESLLTRTSAAKMIRHHFESADSLYAACLAIYKALKQQHAREPALFLRAAARSSALLAALSAGCDRDEKFLGLLQCRRKPPGVPVALLDFSQKKPIDFSPEGSH